MFFNINKSTLFTCLLVITIFIVYGCSSDVRVPVEDRFNSNSFYQNNKKGFNRKNKSFYHLVKKGDTLYSIAWQYGLDYKELASWNKLRKPYLILLGQKLRIIAKPEAYAKINSKKYSKTKKRPYKQKYKPRKPVAVKKKKKQYVADKASNNTGYKTRLNWVWPARGKLIQRFAPAKGKKGIDISLPNRKQIRAAESGKVVYSGHGLTGYGLLIIVKHNSKYLTAYAHNSKLLVQEGKKVKRNQVIALAGKTSSERVKLHFEIRKDGKPVDPLKYLPRL